MLRPQPGELSHTLDAFQQPLTGRFYKASSGLADSSLLHFWCFSSVSHSLRTQDLPNSARFCQVGRPKAAFVVDFNGRESPAGY